VHDDGVGTSLVEPGPEGGDSLGVDVEDGHLDAVGGQVERDGLAQPPGPAGHDGDGSVEPTSFLEPTHRQPPCARSS
jgi:hypothetical protein